MKLLLVIVRDYYFWIPNPLGDPPNKVSDAFITSILHKMLKRSYD
jgi:hypothetical protein